MTEEKTAVGLKGRQNTGLAFAAVRSHRRPLPFETRCGDGGGERVNVWGEGSTSSPWGGRGVRKTERDEGRARRIMSAARGPRGRHHNDNEDTQSETCHVTTSMRTPRMFLRLTSRPPLEWA